MADIAYKPIEKINPISSVVEKEKEFYKKPIVASVAAENTTNLIYTVPKGKIFVWEGLVFQNADINSGGVGGQCYVVVDGLEIFGLLGINGTSTNQVIETTFKTGIIYREGVKFQARSDQTGAIAYVTIVGFQTDPKNYDKIN